MIFELLSHRNNMSYNLKIASIFGVCSAIMLGLLIDAKQEAVIMDKLIDDKFFLLTRQQIYDLTGLDDLKQLEVEDALKECNLIEVTPVKNNSEKFYYSLDEDLLMKFLMAKSNEEAKKLLTKSAQKKSLISIPRTAAPSKRSTYINGLKKSLKEDDIVVRENLCNWIDAVYANPKGFLSASSIEQCLKTLNEFTRGDKDKKIEIIQIAIKNGSRNLDWAMEEYQKKHPVNKLNLTDYTSPEDLKNNIEKIKNGSMMKF